MSAKSAQAHYLRKQRQHLRFLMSAEICISAPKSAHKKIQHTKQRAVLIRINYARNCSISSKVSSLSEDTLLIV